MTLAAGTRLGPYEILSLQGAGGMGAVYRARDTRLQRDVAIKVLPAQHVSDPLRRQRFLREAQAVSALNHPNIVTLHDVGETGDLSYFVMEQVSDRTLDQIIPRDGLRLKETLRLALQIADGLGKAHATGILHRDLKPGNVMVTEDGTAKLLDFGLAKLGRQDEVRSASADSSTASALCPVQDTAEGTVLGTVAYMSPEQAQGKPLDARSDIFSFGAVLYEMATGRRAFQGGSASAVLAAVIAQEPRPPRELITDTPRDLERIIQRCLRKDPDRRFHDISDVKVELLELKEDSDSKAAMSGAGSAVGATATRWSRWRRIALLTTAVAIVAAVAVAVWRAWRVELPAPRVVQLTSERFAGAGSFSPDGTQIAYASGGDIGGNADVWLKIIGEAEARRLTNDTAQEASPAWSPDGTQIAFVRYPDPLRSGSIYLVSPMGGPARRLVDFPVGRAVFQSQLSWSPDGRWLAAARTPGKGEAGPGAGGIHLIPMSGGSPRALTSPEAPAYFDYPAFSPDGRALAYASCNHDLGVACNVNVLALDARLQPAGVSRRLPGAPGWIQGVAWTRDGRSIVYGVNDIPNTYLWRVRADGGAAPERVELAGRGGNQPSIARGRDRLAFTRVLWDDDIYRLQPGSPPAPVLSSTWAEWFPQYSPDGQRIVFASGRSGDATEVWLANADGSDATRLTRGPGRAQSAPRWSPDGRTIAFDSTSAEGRVDVWTIGADGAGLRQVTRDSAADNMPSFSRDGRLLYFGSNRTGRFEIWRVPVAGGAEEQLTHEGGCVPFESIDGRTLYYMKVCWNDALLARPVGGGAERMIFPCVDDTSWAVGPKGIFHVDCKSPESPRQHAVRHWDAVTGQDLPIGTFEAGWTAGLAVSPDGRSILFGRSMMTSDLVMIDNFR